jgi:hypothetical protein
VHGRYTHDLAGLLGSMKVSISILLTLWVTSAFAQREVRTYFDQQKRKPQEIYFTSREDDQKFVGRYQRYYENGNLMVDGNFDDGKKSGAFTEYHENGKIARKLSYVN